MNKFAVIDIGSNSVRLMFVANGKVLYKRINTTRLGEGLAQSPCLNDAAIERSALAVAQFYQRAKEEGAEAVFAFATAAVRTAKNGNSFVERVRTVCGLTVEIVSGEEEAELGVLGALGNTDGAVIDVGGASTELVVKESGALVYKKSVDIGVVRLKDKCSRDEAALYAFCGQAAKEYGEVPTLKTVHAIGGTATTLGALVQSLEEYDSDKVTGTEISAKTMREWSDKLLSMTVEEISVMPCVPKGRADVLAGGVVLFTVLMEKFGWERLIVSDRDNLEGYAIKKGVL